MVPLTYSIATVGVMCWRREEHGANHRMLMEAEKAGLNRPVAAITFCRPPHAWLPLRRRDNHLAKEPHEGVQMRDLGDPPELGPGTRIEHAGENRRQFEHARPCQHREPATRPRPDAARGF